MEGFCMGTAVLITSANGNYQNCKPRCIYQVLKFPNKSPNCYNPVYFFLRLSSAWSSCYMWKHQMLLTYSNNYLNQKFLLLLIVLQIYYMVLKRRKKVLEPFHVKWTFVVNVNCNGNGNICEAVIITITFPCKQTMMKHDINKFDHSLNVESKI